MRPDNQGCAMFAIPISLGVAILLGLVGWLWVAGLIAVVVFVALVLAGGE